MAVPYTVTMPDGSTKTVLANSQAAANNNAGLAASGATPTAPAPAPASTPRYSPTPTPATAPVPAPTSMSYGNTNDQSVRADLRTQGYYIDPTGVYAPGAGNRVQDTFSGDQASQNVAPSPTRLPIINGTPVSPSAGFTGPQTPAVMYRGDPQYNTYFGPGTPGYSSRNAAYDAGPLPAGQATLPGQLPYTPPAAQSQADSFTMGPMIPGTTSGQEQTATPALTPEMAAQNQQASQATGPSYQAAFQQPAQGGNGYGPYATAAPPTLSVQGQYTDESGNVIEKSFDQYGNPYYQKVGTVALPKQDQDTGTGAAPTAPAPAQPQQPANPQQSIALPDGTIYSGQMSPQDRQQLQSDLAAIAQSNANALRFTQGIQQGQLDVQRLTQVASQAYQEGLLKFDNAQLAQQTAYQAMQIDLQKQAQALQAQQQQQTANYQGQQIDVQRQAQDQARQVQAQTNSTEREKLDLQRQAMRHSTRRRSAVQFR